LAIYTHLTAKSAAVTRSRPDGNSVVFEGEVVRGSVDESSTLDGEESDGIGIRADSGRDQEV